MKKLILFISLLFFTGCTFDYNLTVTNDKKYIEEINFVFDKSEFPVGDNNLKDYIKKEISNYTSSTEYYGYNFDYKIKGDNVYVDVKKTHETFEDFQNSPFYKQYFERIYKIEGRNYFVSTGGEFTNPNVLEMPDPDLVSPSYNINIKFYNNVISSNSNLVDEKNNTYTWQIDYRDLERTVEFTLDDGVRYDIIIKDFVMNNLVVIISLTSLISVTLVVGLVFVTNNRRNNKI